MSTNYRHFGNRTIQEVVNRTNWILGDKNGTLSIDKAIELGYFYITNGLNYLWVQTDSEGVIQLFTRYGGNEPDFLIELIGSSVSEYEYDFGILGLFDGCANQSEEDILECDAEFKNWLELNTFQDCDISV